MDKLEQAKEKSQRFVQKEEIMSTPLINATLDYLDKEAIREGKAAPKGEVEQIDEANNVITAAQQNKLEKLKDTIYRAAQKHVSSQPEHKHLSAKEKNDQAFRADTTLAKHLDPKGNEYGIALRKHYNKMWKQAMQDNPDLHDVHKRNSRYESLINR